MNQHKRVDGDMPPIEGNTIHMTYMVMLMTISSQEYNLHIIVFIIIIIIVCEQMWDRSLKPYYCCVA